MKPLLVHLPVDADGSHNVAHLLRVWKNAFAIQIEEGGNARILAASIVLHDCVVVEKDSSLRNQASRLAAEKATFVLRDLGWSPDHVAAVAHAIQAHSFSAAVTPVSLEAKILQDADRLDAIGAIGIARCFYTAGRLHASLYDPEDPAAAARPYDDRHYAIDHFQTKLFKLTAGFQTATGRRLARVREDRLHHFWNAFMEEAGHPVP